MKLLETVLAKIAGPTLAPYLAMALPILAVIGAAAFAAFLAWRASRKKKAAAPSASLPPGASPAETGLRPTQLRRAFRRFSEQLPPDYRRSLLNFEHFVVMGAAGSGKSRVIDNTTDWRRRTKEFVSSQAVDPDLQVYLSSSAVVTELPSTILDDHSERCRTALKHLWRPLYERRSPTVVILLDTRSLLESTQDALRELGETLRSKINVLASIRRAPIEVRVVLSRLDELNGYDDFVSFALATSLPTRIPLASLRERAAEPKGVRAAVETKSEIEAWFEALRGHMPRALTLLSADSFRRFVTFLRRLPEVAPPLGQLVDTLLAPDPLSPTPMAGGIYLVSDAESVSNPLKGAAEIGPGPDPRRPHFALASSFAGLAVTYLTLAFMQQRAVWVRASSELEGYSASTLGSEREARRRDAIVDFAYRKAGMVQRFPDFFQAARLSVRKKFSDAVRDELLVPRLRAVTLRGDGGEGGASTPRRRGLYFLALIHSDRDDRMKILDPQRLNVWSEMTGFSPELMRDYLLSVDAAYSRPVEFDFADRDLDPSDTTASWMLFFRRTQEALADGVVDVDELKELRGRSTLLGRALTRVEHDDITRGIYDQLDDAAGIGDKAGGRLKLGYLPKYRDFVQNVESADVFGQRDPLRRILRAVDTSTELSKTTLLRALSDAIALRYATEAEARPDDVVRVRLSGAEYVFDLRKWADAIRDSAASEEIVHFMRSGEGDAAIFFSGRILEDARPLTWNPGNDGSVLFTGKASIDARYTRAAYDKHVREVVKKFSEVLEKSRVPSDRKKQVREFVREHVRRYALEYKRQLLAFYRSFGLAASSPEALRVAISQIVADASPFNDFLEAVDKQVTVEDDDAQLEPMHEIVSEFAAWHGALSPSAGAPEIAKYKAICAQLLADLGPGAEASSAGPAAGAIANAEPQTSGPTQTLERALSSTGRLVLANLRGDKGSYGALVAAWVASIKLPESQQAPFLAPVVQLGAIGRRDIQDVLKQAWEREVQPDLLTLSEKFPFARNASLDVTPQELTAMLHPQTGRVFDAYRRLLEPVSEVDGLGYHLHRSLRGSINPPAGMYAFLSQAAHVSSRLWDASGKPVPIEVRIATVPFEHGPDPRLALTRTYVNVGEASIVNFNQKPTEKTLRIDWTREQASQVGIQLTDLDTKDSTFPEPIVIDSSFWSFHKLLGKAKPSGVKYPPDATLYSWDIKVGKGRTETGRARFVVIGDPFHAFKLGRAAATARISEAKPARSGSSEATSEASESRRQGI
jgi:hypothetical protein